MSADNGHGLAARRTTQLHIADPRGRAHLLSALSNLMVLPGAIGDALKQALLARPDSLASVVASCGAGPGYDSVHLHSLNAPL
jgi:hypothetical protein